MFAVLESLSILEQVAPRLAAEVVWRMWRTPRKPRTVPESAKRMMALADHSTEWLAGRRIATRRWGTGPRQILREANNSY